jgi:uncharacterized protein (DUF1684 family)
MQAKNRLGKVGAFLFPLLALFFVLAGQLLPAQVATEDQVPVSGDSAWQQELLKERGEKDIEFKTSATSPMAGSARLTITALGKTFITIADGTVSAQPRAVGKTVFAVFYKEGKWYWNDAAPDVTCLSGERAVAQNSDALAPGSLFKAGRFTLAAYPGPDTLALIVFDPQRPQLVHFEHLLYFHPDANYAVKARLEKFPQTQEVKITTTRRLEKTFYRYGLIHFKLEGKDLVLTAFKSSLAGPDSTSLFIPFKDATNGHESYEVGRFIDVEEPPRGDFVLDFNRCYNPLCNYSPAYNCPLPPLENFLDAAIRAGEKAYPH